MCGLAGFTGFGKADPAKMRILLMENQERGSHSTGIFGGGKLMRKASPAKEFIKDPNFDSIAESNVVIAHTRFSTGTARTKENAHPFLFELGYDKKYGKQYIAGTHNGWVVNEHEMETLVEGFKRDVVDSASIYKLMAFIESRPEKEKKKILKALDIESPEFVFKKFEGAMALAFIYKGCLHLYRRNSRPLFVGKTKEGIYYSSLKESLERIGIPDSNIWGVKQDRLIRFVGSRISDIKEVSPPRVHISENCSTYSWDSGVDKKLVEELTGKKFPPVGERATNVIYIGTTAGATKQTGADGNQNTKVETMSRKSVSAVLSHEDIRQIKGRTVYGRNLLIPSRIDDGFDIREYLVENIKNSSTRRVFVESIDRFKIYGNLWAKHLEQRSAFTLPLYSMVAKPRITEIKRPGSGFLSIDLRGYKDGHGEFFFNREDMYIHLSIGGHTDTSKNMNIMEKPNGFNYSVFLTPELKSSVTGAFEVDLSIIFSKIPGIVFNTSIRIYPDTPSAIRTFIDVDRIFAYTAALANRDSTPSFLPVGQYTQSMLSSCRNLYSSMVIGGVPGLDPSKVAIVSSVTAYHEWNSSKENLNSDKKSNRVIDISPDRSKVEKTKKEEILEDLRRARAEIVKASEAIHSTANELKKKLADWGSSSLANELSRIEEKSRDIRESVIQIDRSIEFFSESVVIPTEKSIRV